MLSISDKVKLSESEVQLTAMRAQGAGGQNVNKVSSAIHLRFDINASSLPDFIKQNLLALNDNRINKEGELIIKAQKFRTQEQNREDALARLVSLIQSATYQPKMRHATKPTRASQQRRLEAKSSRSSLKKLRGRLLDL